MTSSPPQRAPARIELTEVGLRDGLQNEARVLSTEHKLELLHGLHRAGLRRFELTSFVSPRAVPALADAAELVAAAKGLADARFSALVPNLRGAERALEVGIDRVVLFVSASETHNARNVNRSIDASLAGFADIVERLSSDRREQLIQAIGPELAPDVLAELCHENQFSCRETHLEVLGLCDACQSSDSVAR